MNVVQLRNQSHILAGSGEGQQGNSGSMPGPEEAIEI